jgi:hemoglobin
VTASGDLDRRAAVHDAVVGFYREVVHDDVLGPVFEEVAAVDWATHIPRLIDYWCQVLLGDEAYGGSIVAAHVHVHRLAEFRLDQFDRWYALWAATVDASWAGPCAEHAKRHAAKVASSLARRLLDTSWEPPPAGALEVA